MNMHAGVVVVGLDCLLPGPITDSAIQPLHIKQYQAVFSPLKSEPRTMRTNSNGMISTVFRHTGWARLERTTCI